MRPEMGRRKRLGMCARHMAAGLGSGLERTVYRIKWAEIGRMLAMRDGELI